MTSEFPKRPDAHVSEDVSIRVFQECLPPKWIFRDQGSRNDYGIDAEVELVTEHGELRGDIAKIQLKGHAHVEFNSDGVAAVGGIKQATLRYWIGLCRYANVFACLTDNPSRETYFTPVFWEATARLDDSNETRSLHFTKEWSLRDVNGPALFTIAARHRPPEVVSAHKGDPAWARTHVARLSLGGASRPLDDSPTARHRSELAHRVKKHPALRFEQERGPL